MMLSRVFLKQTRGQRNDFVLHVQVVSSIHLLSNQIMLKVVLPTKHPFKAFHDFFST